MNTLPQQVTSAILGSPDAFENLRVQWGQRVGNGKLTAAHHFLYLVLQGKDWRKAFPMIIRSRRLANDALAQWKLSLILHQIHSPDFEQALLEPFGGVFTLAMLENIRAILPQEAIYPNTDVYWPRWPYDAYNRQAVIELLNL